MFENINQKATFVHDDDYWQTAFYLDDKLIKTGLL